MFVDNYPGLIKQHLFAFSRLANLYNGIVSALKIDPCHKKEINCYPHFLWITLLIKDQDCL